MSLSVHHPTLLNPALQFPNPLISPSHLLTIPHRHRRHLWSFTSLLFPLTAVSSPPDPAVPRVKFRSYRPLSNACSFHYTAPCRAYYFRYAVFFPGTNTPLSPFPLVTFSHSSFYLYLVPPVDPIFFDIQKPLWHSS